MDTSTQPSITSPLNKPHRLRKLLMIVGLAIAFVVIGSGGYYLGANSFRIPSKQSDITRNQTNNKTLRKAPTLSLQQFTPVPSGGKLIYAISREEGNRYLEKSLTSGTENYLMNNPTKKDTNLKISPDGKKIALAREYWGFIVHDVTSLEDSLIVKNTADFEDPTKNRVYSPYQWSPDSKKMLVRTGFWESHGLGVADIETKDFKEINGYDNNSSNCLNGTWTPDSTKVILYGYNYGHPCNTMPGLHIASVTESGNIVPTPLYGTDKHEKVYSVTEAYSPDNKVIYFYAGVGIGKSPEDGYYSIPIQGGKAQKIQVDNFGKIWLTDSSYFYYNNSGIELYDMTTKTTKVIVENKDAKFSVYPVAISPDKKYLAFILSANKYDQSGNLIYGDTTGENLLKVISLDTHKVYDIDKNLHTDAPVRWLP